MSLSGKRLTIWRAAYKAAWFVRKVVRLAPWPPMNGALAAVWVDGRVLLVRNSYNEYHTLPGGRLNAGESYRHGAARELREETGIAVDPEKLASAHAENIRRPFGQDRVEIFAVVLADRPDLVIDAVEIAEADWVCVEEAFALPLYGPTRRYLRSIAQVQGQPSIDPA